MRLSKDESISILQLTLWMVAVHLSPTFFFFPAFSSIAGQDGWMAVLLAIPLIAWGVFIILRLVSVAPHLSLPEAIQAAAGPVLGRALNLALAVYFLFHAAFALWTLEELLTTIALPRTPRLAITGTMMCIVLTGARRGIETIARTVGLLVFGGILSVSLIMLLLLPDAQLRNLTPFLAVGWPSLAWATFANVAHADFLPLAAAFLPFVSAAKGRERRLLLVPLIANGFISLAFAMTVAVLTFPVAENLVFEFLGLVRYIAAAEFLERLDPLLLIGWVVLGFLRIAAHFVAALLALRSVFRLNDYRFLSMPLAVLALVWSETLFSNTRERSEFSNSSLSACNLAFGYVLPALLLALFMLNRHRLAPRGGGPPAKSPGSKGEGAEGPASKARRG